MGSVAGVVSWTEHGDMGGIDSIGSTSEFVYHWEL